MKLPTVVLRSALLHPSPRAGVAWGLPLLVAVLSALFSQLALGLETEELPLHLEDRVAPDNPDMRTILSSDWSEPSASAKSVHEFAPVPQAFAVISPAARQPLGALSGRIVFMNGGHGWTYDPNFNPPWRLLRGTQNEMNEDHGNIDQLNFFAAYCFNAGAVVVPCRPLGQQTNQVVLDNDAASVTFTGAWSDSTSTLFYGSAGDVPYRYASFSATETAAATYTPNIPQTGYYPVYTWVRHGSDRGYQLYRIRHTGGETQVRIPHHMVGNGWVYLGEYYFNEGSDPANGSVVISNLRETSAGSIVVADAIRFGNGMGSSNNGGGGSGYPRECESARYWIKNSLGQGQSSSLYDGSGNDEQDNWSASPKWSAEMNREQAGSFYDRIHISFHSNAGGGRGSIGLIEATDPTPNQSSLAKTAGKEVNDDLVALGSPPLELPWYNRSSWTYTSGYSEIDNSLFNGEMDATMIEVAFHDDASDAKLLRDSKARAAIGKAAMHAVIKHLNKFDTASPPPLAYLPEPPANPRAVAGNGGAITLSWEAPVNLGGSQNPTNYIIYRSTNGYGFGNPIFVGNVTSYSVTGLSADTDYYFRVSASNAGGESMPSEVVGCRASSIPGAPKALVVNAFDRFDRTSNLRMNTGAQNYSPPDGSGSIERVWPRRVNSFDYVVQHGKSIAAFGMAFDSCQRQAVTNGAVSLANYPIVIWEAGQSRTDTFSAIEQSMVSAFLAARGNLFVTGAKIAYDLDRASGPSAADRNFLKNQLHADLTSDANTNAASYTFTPTAGSIFEGNANGTYDNGAKGIYWVQTADVVSPYGSGATAALNYTANANGAAAVQYDGSAGDGKVVYFAFPFETITSAARRDAYMASVLSFFSAATPPSITAQPQSQSVPADTDAAFAVTAQGTPPLRYQWRFNGADISGATQDTCTRENVQTNDAGSYSVVITNDGGAVTSSVAVLTVIAAPLVLIQPADVVAPLGQDAEFAVTATGAAPLGYQWRFNGADLPGASTSGLLRADVQAADAGAYAVVVSNRFGSVTSAPASLIVLDPFIEAQPENQMATPGAAAAFSISAGGTPPLNYQWLKGGVELTDGGRISGASTASLTVTDVEASDMGNYAVRVSNVHGSVTSSNATLIGPFAPAIVTQPAGQKLPAASAVRFAAQAVGDEPLTFQWRRDGINLADGGKVSGATTANLAITDIQSGEMGSYSVMVSNTHGQTVSTDALLSLCPLIGWGNDIYTQATVPAGLTNIAAIGVGFYHSIALKPDGAVTAWGAGTTNSGSGSQFGQAIVPAGLTGVVAVAAGGYHTLALKGDGAVVAWGAGTSEGSSPHYGQSLVPADLSNVVSVAAGFYHSLAALSDGTVRAWGAGASDLGTLPHAGQCLVPAGLSNVIAVAAGNYHSLALRNDGTVVAWGAGMTSTGVLPHYGQSQVPEGLSNVVAIAAGSYHSLALKADRTVAAWGSNTYGQTNVPADLTNVVAIAGGNNYSMALKADGTVLAWGANSYGQTNIPGGLADAIAVAAGGYHDLVLAADGSPHLTVEPRGRTAQPGQRVVLTALAVGAQPMTYQWQRNGSNLAGATNPSLILEQVQATDAGFYTVLVTNDLGSIVSTAAILTVPGAQPLRFETIALQTGNQVRLLLSGPPGTYAVETSADLVTWGSWTNITLTTNPVELLDTPPAGAPSRFYRATTAP